jgi:hypothetical protein
MVEQRLDEAGSIMSFDDFIQTIDLPKGNKIKRTGVRYVPEVG